MLKFVVIKVKVRCYKSYLLLPIFDPKVKYYRYSVFLFHQRYKWIVINLSFSCEVIVFNINNGIRKLFFII